MERGFVRWLTWRGAATLITAGIGFCGAALSATSRSQAIRSSVASGKQVVSRIDPSAAAVVRVNQVGYLPRESKIAVIQSPEELTERRFWVVTLNGGDRRFEGRLGADLGPYGSFAHHYRADFSRFEQAGAYTIQLAGGVSSPSFSIGAGLYRHLPELILTFFRVQRCGRTGPLGHAPCHLSDAQATGGPDGGRTVDLTGGWHDAGDYLKFATTISYATLLLLECANRYPHAVPRTPAGASPLLQEARVGVQWLLKLQPRPDGFYYQVGSEAEHDRWERPEADALLVGPDGATAARQGLFGAGANVAGRSAAALALAARLYQRADPALARRCRQTAVAFYECGLQHPVVVTTQPADFYPEQTWEQDMALAAERLYQLTHEPSYLSDALRFAEVRGTGGGALSLYGLHGLAHAGLVASAGPGDRQRLLAALREDCDQARARATDPFRLAVDLTWGTAGRACGAGTLCLLGAPLLHDPSLTELARAQRDYLLGCNPFGVSFLIGAGQRYPHHPHHPLAQLGPLPLVGAVVGGPAPPKLWREQKMADGMGKDATPIPPELQSPTAVYYDDAGDWVTNEPAIDYAVDTLLLLAAYAGG
jgi:endoglucanase